MSVSDARELAVYYDKYDFQEGRRCCDVVLAEVFQALQTPSLHGVDDFRKKPNDLKDLIDMYILADAATLKTTKNNAKTLFLEFLQRVKHCRLLDLSDLERLVPLIKADKLLSEWTDEKISLTTFPEDFLREMGIKHELEQAIPQIEITWAQPLLFRGRPAFDPSGVFNREESHGLFKKESPIYFADSVYDMFLGIDGGFWIIYITLKDPPTDQPNKPRILFACLRTFDRWVLPPVSHGRWWLCKNSRFGIDKAGTYKDIRIKRIYRD